MNEEKLTGKDFWNTCTHPCIAFTDGPTGVRPQEGEGDNLGLNSALAATCFPTHSALACSWNKALVKALGKAVGEEARYFSKDVLLAPALNVKRSPLCGRNFEYFSEDGYLNGKLGAAFASGVNLSGARACVKHFAANSREYGRTVCDGVLDERTLREIYLTPFEIAVKEGKPAAVMTAYNKVNSVYCNENEYLIRGILRGEWNFCGAVISDWGGTHDRIAAVKAGADLEMPYCAFSTQRLTRALDSGEIDQDEIDACAQRISSLAAENAYSGICDFESHAAIAQTAAQECAVLLKNEGVLPLTAAGKTALIGLYAKKPLIQGGGSSKVNPNSSDSLLNELKEDIIGYSQGYTRRRIANLSKTLKLCRAADAVVFCMGREDDSEGRDRKDVRLPAAQTELLKKISKLNKKIIAVVFSGGVFDCEWEKYCSAIVWAGLCGQGSFKSLAKILKGELNPCGKTCETFAYDLNDLPCNGFYGNSPYYSVYKEGMSIGYRSGVKARYPFGFGLSYTCFKYSDLIADECGVKFKISNTGERQGAEIAQLYLEFPPAANSCGLQLKGFEKVVLQAGEEREIFIPFDGYAFRSYCCGKGWVTVSGDYKIYVGASSENLPLSQVLTVSGNCDFCPPPRTENLKQADYRLKRNERGRICADEFTPLCELKNAKALTGRLLSKLILRAVRKNPVLYGTLEYLPLRTVAQFARFNERGLCGLLDIFNGKTVRGIFKILRGGR